MLGLKAGIVINAIGLPSQITAGVTCLVACAVESGKRVPRHITFKLELIKVVIDAYCRRNITTTVS